MKDCQKNLNKSGVLAMPADATPIRYVISSPAATSISHTRDFKWLRKKKSKGLISGEYGSQTKGPLCPIFLLGYVAWRWLRTAME
ncbi:hypothetical protein TNCV_2763711 [Trichonephila clavipes]|nr:hypothetical protein TNCV_2763711 [Trichonephila clavipes]